LTLLSASVVSFLSIAFFLIEGLLQCWRNRCGQAALPTRSGEHLFDALHVRFGLIEI